MTDRHESRAATHADDCWSWGSGHYDCAVREIERLRDALGECHALSVTRWRRLLAAESEIERLRKELAAAAEQPESRAITALKVTLFGVECYLPASIAEAVQERCDESALEQREGWKPIETAPRGGVEFLSVANYTDEPRQTQIVDWDFVQQCQPGLYTHWMPLPSPPKESE